MIQLRTCLRAVVLTIYYLCKMKKKQIVIFEEFESISNIIQKALESKGYEVIKLAKLEESEKIFNGISYSLLIADNDNRNNDTYQLINKIRGISSYLFLPIVLMVTGDQELYTGKYAEQNIACFLTKPFDMSHFYSVVERLA